MTTLRETLERQARWQRERAQLSWPEKIRLAEVMREALLVLRAGRPPREQPREQPPEQPPEQPREQPREQPPEHPAAEPPGDGS